MFGAEYTTAEPAYGDCVLIEDREGCEHCKTFGPHWDKYGDVFTDTMFKIDAQNPPKNMQKFLSHANGQVPTIFIVGSEPKNREIGDAVRLFIDKSYESGHTPDDFVRNMRKVAKRAPRGPERKTLTAFYDALNEEHRVISIVSNIGASADSNTAVPQGLSNKMTKAEETVVESIGSILDHLSIEDEYGYGE